MEPFSKPFEPSGTRRRGINSVEQGVAVLQAVVELRAAASLKDIARVAGMDSSQTHRYISSLVNCGMVRQDPASGLYDLGPTALRTGLAALARLDPIAQIDAAARDLARCNGGTTLLSVWAIGGPTIIRWYHGTPPVYTALTIGSVLPLTASATGKIFLAFLSDPLLAPLLKSEGFVTPDRDPQLAIERERVRTACFATVDNKVIPGLRAMSSPVFGAGEQMMAAITIIASDATPLAADAAREVALRATCRSLTLDLGGHWDGPA